MKLNSWAGVQCSQQQELNEVVQVCAVRALRFSGFPVLWEGSWAAAAFRPPACVGTGFITRPPLEPRKTKIYILELKDYCCLFHCKKQAKEGKGQTLPSTPEDHVRAR